MKHMRSVGIIPRVNANVCVHVCSNHDKYYSFRYKGSTECLRLTSVMLLWLKLELRVNTGCMCTSICYALVGYLDYIWAQMNGDIHVSYLFGNVCAWRHNQYQYCNFLLLWFISCPHASLSHVALAEAQPSVNLIKVIKWTKQSSHYATS